jgi:hypothetical protein
MGKGCDNIPQCSFRRRGIFDLEEALTFFFVLSMVRRPLICPLARDGLPAAWVRGATIYHHAQN